MQRNMTPAAVSPGWGPQDTVVAHEGLQLDMISAFDADPSTAEMGVCRKAVPPSHASMHEAGWSHVCHKLPHLQAATVNGVIPVQLHQQKVTTVQ